MPGAEVVDGDHQAGRVQLVEQRTLPMLVAHYRGLGQLDAELARREAVALDLGDDRLRQVAAPELAGRNVECEAGLAPEGGPRGGLAAQLFDDPVADSVDQPGLLGHGDEGPGRHEAVLGVLPAHEGLQRMQAPVADAEDGLVVQPQLVL